MKRISTNTWSKYKSLIQSFVETDSGLKPIAWLKNLSQPLPFGEDVGSRFVSKELKVLVGYNSFRTWPINSVTTSGELDNESCYILMSINYLSGLGYLNSNGKFDFDQTLDRFIIDGIVYKSSGETAYDQASDTDNLAMVILKRINEKVENYKIVS